MFVEINKSSSTPIYRQLEAAIKNKILRNELPMGYKLPSERSLAESLGINRNTVVKAYKLLADQELVSSEIKHRKGYFVIFSNRETILQYPGKNDAVFRYHYNPSMLEKTFDDIYNASFHDTYVSFGGHVMPDELILVDKIKDVINFTVEKYGAQAFSYCSPKGSPVLRKAIVQYLNKEGLRVKESEVVIVNETTQGLEFVSNCLAGHNEVVASENPIMPDAYGIFRRNDLKVILAEMEPDGVNLEELENIFRKYKPKFSTPCRTTIR